jgi:phosphoglycolate phosphatase-like HAD superfamily hydrolase
MQNRTECVAFDLDGTLADYTGGWKHHADFPGDPLPGIRDNLEQLQKMGFTIGLYNRGTNKLLQSGLKSMG